MKLVEYEVKLSNSYLYLRDLNFMACDLGWIYVILPFLYLCNESDT